METKASGNTALNEWNAIKQTKENHMQFILRTIAAGVISIAASIIIKKIQEKNQPDTSA